MDMTDLIERLNEIERKKSAYNYARGVVNYDGLTVAPKGSVESRSNCFAMISEELYKLTYGEDVGGLLRELYANRDALGYVERRRVERLQEDYDRNCKVPMNEFIELSVLVNESKHVWHGAKNNNDFATFMPYIEKIVEKKKKIAGFINPDADPYEVYLSDYVKGVDRKFCDDYFEQMKEAIVPLIRRVGEKKQVDSQFLKGSFPIEKQRELAGYLMEVMTLPSDRCILGEVEHPCMLGLDLNDIRITTHYYEDNLLMALFSVIHEAGHGLYELGISPAYRNTILKTPVSSAMHECQSRFFENYIARSEAFCGFLLPKLQEIFPEKFNDVTVREFFLAANKAEPSLIRIQADELTYSMHIMIRYEIEKMLFDGDITAAQIPETWRRLYKEYLGVDVPDDTHGALQDVHWSNGMFGQFPAYSLGSAYAAQMLASMKKSFDVYASVAKGELAPVVSWLGEKVHKDGGALDVPDILLQSCGAPFEPHYYFEYLTEKFSAIYQLD